MRSYVPAFVCAMLASLLALSGCSSKKSTQPKTQPSAPTSLFGFATCENDAILNWIDNASNETGYRIERATAGGAFALLVTLAANTTSYTDESTVASTNYQYRVAAAGERNSAFSNTASVAVANGAGVTPEQVAFAFGRWYKGKIGSNDVTPPLYAGLRDNLGNWTAEDVIALTLLSGDGTLSNAAIAVDSSCVGTFAYTFSGQQASAYIRASYVLRGVASADAEIRANALIPGNEFQGQYVINSDTYRNVVALNGPPASIDIDPNFWINYANYESTLGLVVVLEDANQNSAADSTEDVLGVIVNTVYAGQTLDSIGIGSSISEVRAALGQPDTVFLDATPPPAVVLDYSATLGLTLFGRTTDTTIFEFHLFPPSPPLPANRTRPPASAVQSAAAASYRSFR